MKTEKSCGAVAFTRENEEIRYVIIQSKEGIFGFPKGHMEGRETEEETALREVLEETGLQVRLINGFRTEDSHPIYRDGKPCAMKHIVYFLAEYENQIPVAQETELMAIHLMSYDAAMSAFQFESSRRILNEANHYLSKE